MLNLAKHKSLASGGPLNRLAISKCLVGTISVVPTIKCFMVMSILDIIRHKFLALGGQLQGA